MATGTLLAPRPDSSRPPRRLPPPVTPCPCLQPRSLAFRSSPPTLATFRSRRAEGTLPRPPARPQKQGPPPRSLTRPRPLAPRRRRSCLLPAEAPQETLTPAHGYPLGAIFGKQGPIGAGTTSSVTLSPQAAQPFPTISFRSFLLAARTSLRALTRARQGRDEGESVRKYEGNPRPAAGLVARRSEHPASPDYFVLPRGAAGSTFFTADPILRCCQPIGQRAGVKGRQRQSAPAESRKRRPTIEQLVGGA